MDGEMAELQFLGFLGICFEACKLIASRGKLFSKIALSLILPVSVLFLAHVQITDLVFAKIGRNVDEMNFTPTGSAAENNIASRILSEYAALLLFKVVYLVVVVIFSLFSTSAVVYTVACVYTAKDASFRNVMAIVPKVWKRLMVTFLCSVAIISVYNFVFILISVILILILILIAGDNFIAIIIAIIILVLFYLVGLVYISIVWYLAAVVSVLEDVYGIAALQKSMNLVRGKRSTVFAILLVLMILSFGMGLMLGIGQLMGLGVKLLLALVILVIMTLLHLVQLVVQTVVYFVCKSYHNESIDKSILSDHLDVYSGEYLPLKQNDVQLEQCHV